MGDQLSQFLIGSFTVLGFEIQNWMAMFIGTFAIYFVLVWSTGGKSERE
jgi:hypothetical protein